MVKGNILCIEVKRRAKQSRDKRDFLDQRGAGQHPQSCDPHSTWDQQPATRLEGRVTYVLLPET